MAAMASSKKQGFDQEEIGLQVDLVDLSELSWFGESYLVFEYLNVWGCKTKKQLYNWGELEGDVPCLAIAVFGFHIKSKSVNLRTIINYILGCHFLLWILHCPSAQEKARRKHGSRSQWAQPCK